MSFWIPARLACVDIVMANASIETIPSMDLVHSMNQDSINTLPSKYDENNDTMGVRHVTTTWQGIQFWIWQVVPALKPCWVSTSGVNLKMTLYLIWAHLLSWTNIALPQCTMETTGLREIYVYNMLLLGQAALVLKSCQALMSGEVMMPIHPTRIHIISFMEQQA